LPISGNFRNYGNFRIPRQEAAYSYVDDWLILQMWLARATKLRQLLTQTYDVIDKQLMGGACESHVTENGHTIGIL